MNPRAARVVKKLASIKRREQRVRRYLAGCDRDEAATRADPDLSEPSRAHLLTLLAGVRARFRRQLSTSAMLQDCLRDLLELVGS